MTWNQIVVRSGMLLLPLGLLTVSAHANIIETDFFSNTGFTISTTNDLIDGVLPSAISGTSDREGLGTDTTGAALTNGVFGPAGLVEGGPNPDVTILDNGASITYLLSMPSTIMEIDTYTGWRDPGRSQQNYVVSVSTDGTTFTPLFTTSSGAAPTSPSDVEVALTNGGAPLATGVEAIQFDFPTTQNGYVGYRELDVIGSSSIPTPEPASLVLLGLGGLSLLVRRRFVKARG